MIDSAILEGLKRVNVSTDKEKTKERVEAIWKPLDASSKRAFVEEAEINEATVIRIRKEGAITPKMALMLASHFGVEPSYITGDADEDAGWSDEAMNAFLKSKNKQRMKPRETPKRKYTRRKEKDSAAEASAMADSANAGMSEDDMILLLRALNVRAQFSSDAKKQLSRIVGILVK